MRILLIDDCRDPQSFAATHVARTFDEGLRMLRDEGPWDEVVFDHDLGDYNPAHTGYDLLCWLEQNPEYVPKEISICTANSVGAAKMWPLANKLLGR